ncbi:MAG TPA: hypothetical protein VFA59_04790 [Vicinamibacterales bacterium]|nr:hypothetical protein [Vicinamibacterales bacterium]
MTTTIFPTATDTDQTNSSTLWTFRFLNAEALKDLDGSMRVACTFPDPATGAIVTRGANQDMTTKQAKISCVYHPQVKSDKDEAFKYEVTRCDRKDDQTPCSNVTSAPADVTITVKSEGLRWEITTNANQSVSSDAPAAGNIPNTIGKTTQDVMLSLDWVFRSPQYLPRHGEQSVNATTFDGHFVFRTGLTTKAEAVTATPLVAAGDTTPMPPAPSAASQRHFSTGGELNYNLVLPSTGTGSFLEIGGLARGTLDADVEGTATNQEAATQIFKLVRNGNASYTAEVGVRATLKQYHEDMFAMSVQRGEGEAVEHPKNSDDFVTAEFGYQRNTGVAGLESLGISQNRYFLRVVATPIELPNVPGHTKPMIGVQLSGGSGQPKEVKILYGVDLSIIRAALGL